MADEASPQKAVKPGNRRSAARLAAVQALYQMDIAGTPIEEVLAEFETFRLGHELDGIKYRDADPAFFRDIVSGVVRSQLELDPAIHETLREGWPLARIDVTLRAILRSAAHELRSRKDVPPPVVISEYVDVAKAFFAGDEPRLVNGVLDALARKIRPAGAPAPRAAEG